MALFDSPTDGFDATDFDVYQQACWSSNVHNLQRMKTKEKLLSVVKRVAKAVANNELAVASSSEIPSVWNGRQVKEQLVYVSRDVHSQKRLQSVIAREFDLAERIKAGAEHERHLILFARIDAEALTVGLRFTRFSLVDNRNFLQRLETEADVCDALLSSLGDSITFNGESIDRARLTTALNALSDGRLDAFELSRHWRRDAVIELGDAIEETLRESLTNATGLFEAVLWTEDNDHLNLSETLDALSQQVSAALVQKTQEREAKAAANAERATAARERTNAKVVAEQAWRQMQQSRRTKDDSTDSGSTSASASTDNASSTRKSPRPKRGTDKVPTRTGTANSRTKKAGGAKTSSTKKPTRGKSTRKTPKKDWSKGDECTLSRGLFAGKKGTIVETPSKGYAKVKVGVIEVNVSVLELDL